MLSQRYGVVMIISASDIRYSRSSSVQYSWALLMSWSPVSITTDNEGNSYVQLLYFSLASAFMGQMYTAFIFGELSSIYLSYSLLLVILQFLLRTLYTFCCCCSWSLYCKISSNTSLRLFFCTLCNGYDSDGLICCDALYFVFCNKRELKSFMIATYINNVLPLPVGAATITCSSRCTMLGIQRACTFVNDLCGINVAS